MTRADASSPVTLRAAVEVVAAAFRDAGIETPGLDARRLVLGLVGLDGAALLRAPERLLTIDQRAGVEAACARRLRHEPVSRILGCRAFHGLDLEIGPSTLDPRPDTETLVEGVLRLIVGGLVPGGCRPHILDIGTGSGAILIALLKALPEATGLATDISADALEIAARNAERHGITERISFRRTCWLRDVDGPFDIVVSNPPYIPTADLAALEPEVAGFDPVAALDGGADGLDAYREIAGAVRRVVRPGGWVVVEVGQGQASAVTELFQNGLGAANRDRAKVEIWPDLGGIDRCVAVEARI